MLRRRDEAGDRTRIHAVYRGNPRPDAGRHSSGAGTGFGPPALETAARVAHDPGFRPGRRQLPWEPTDSRSGPCVGRLRGTGRRDAVRGIATYRVRPRPPPFRLAFLSRLSYWCDIRWAWIWAMKSITTTTTISSEVPPK